MTLRELLRSFRYQWNAGKKWRLLPPRQTVRICPYSIRICRRNACGAREMNEIFLRYRRVEIYILTLALAVLWMTESGIASW